MDIEYIFGYGYVDFRTYQYVDKKGINNVHWRANLSRQKINSRVTCKIHVNSRVMERSHVNWQIVPGQKNGVCPAGHPVGKYLIEFDREWATMG